MITTKEQVLQQLNRLSEAGLQQVANYIAFLIFQERKEPSVPGNKTHPATLYQTSASEERALPAGENSNNTLGLTTENETGSAVRELSLEQMLAQVTEDNRHGEIDFGPAVGKEVW